jgi:hypothetical protein
MKLNSTVSKILTNKWVLNIVSVLALLNVIGYMVMGNFNNVLFFMVLAILVRYFSKNMILVLGIPLIIVNIFAMKQTSYIEGMDNNNKGNNNEKTHDNKNDQSVTSDSTDLSNNVISSNIQDKQQSGFEVGRKKSGSAKIDYAATIEDAYDDLNKILGSDGMKSLTDDTQRLMKQQMELAESMKAMTPIVEKMLPMAEQAQKMMAGMDTQGNGMAGLLDMAKKMSTGLGGASTPK